MNRFTSTVNGSDGSDTRPPCASSASGMTTTRSLSGAVTSTMASSLRRSLSE